jgi:uncharacterized RDD family membrane protein YckC
MAATLRLDPGPGAAPELAHPLVGPTPPARRGLTPGSAASALEAAAALAPGDELGHFRIIRLLGKGGMGAVYLARDLSLERDVALKVIAAGLLGPEEDVGERFVREARSQARLSHPNVVQIYFIGEQGALRFFAMEYVAGATLEELLAARGTMPWQDVLDLLLGVARALQAAHAQGLVHRDLKPSNLMLARGAQPGDVKVADFGLVKWLDADAGQNPNLTAKGIVLGTPRYMAPEQGLGEPTDHRADFYALGATAYHLLSGRPPFEAPTPMALVAKHITATPPPLSTCGGYVPPGLVHVITRLLAKKPADRFQTHAELLEALEGARAAALAPAGFWVRGVATLVDAAFLSVLCWGVSFWALALYPVYYIVLHRLCGQSLGKRLLGVRVHAVDGRLPSTPRLLLRAAVAITGFTLALGLAEQRRELAAPFFEGVMRAERDAFDAAITTRRSPAFDVSVRVRIYRLAWQERRALAHAYWPSAALCLVSLLGVGVAIFDRQRRALHDIVAGTLVTYDLGRRGPG